MNLRERKSVIWRVAAGFFGAILLFSTPASQVAAHAWPLAGIASVANGGGDLHSTHIMTLERPHIDA